MFYLSGVLRTERQIEKKNPMEQKYVELYN